MERGARRVLGALIIGSLLGCARSERADRAPEAEVAMGRKQPESARESADAKEFPAFLERRSERAALARSIADMGVEDQRVLAAMERVPRHEFVPREMRDAAYADRPLPIGGGQTISQPYIVAAMTEAAKPRATSRCLEIGTGSGYQAAVLAEVCAKVYSIEYLPEVAAFGEANLRRLGYGPDRVELRVGDGYVGWPEAAPFDAILVTAAPEKVPPPLLQQLSVGGYLVVPVGPTSSVQYLERWKRLKPGADPSTFDQDRLMGVRFVPFLGDAGAH